MIEPVEPWPNPNDRCMICNVRRGCRDGCDKSMVWTKMGWAHRFCQRMVNTPGDAPRHDPSPTSPQGMRRLRR